MVSPAPSCTTRPSLSTTIRSAIDGRVRVVGDHDHRLAELVHGLPQQGEHLVGGLRVEVAGRLVGEHHRRAVDQRARHGDALLLTAGQLGRPVGEPVAEADGVDQLVEPLLVGLLAGERERQQDVLLGGQHRHEVEGLEDEPETIAAQARERAVVEVGELGAVDHDGARGRAVEPREQVHQRRLAGPGRAHDGGVLAGREADGDAREGVDGGISFAVDAAEL